MKTINKLLCLLILVVSTASLTVAQDSREYDFTADKKGNLHKDANGNTIDFSSSTSLVSAGASNTNSQIQDLPFNVLFLGKVYKSFLVGTSGYLVLGNTDIPAEPFQFPTANSNSFSLGNNNYRFQGVIAPFWDFQNAQSIKYTVTGSAPNRAFVVEWVTYIPSATGAKNGEESNYQVRIYEATGVVEFVYGKMVVPAANISNITATIGVSANSALADYNFLAITNLDSLDTAKTLTNYTPTGNILYNKSDSGVIAPLNYTNDSVANRFSFVPNSMYAPNNLTAINVTYDNAVLYWDDNSNNETGFEIYKLGRDGNYYFFNSTKPNISFYLVDGFYPGESYTYRVRAVGQGRYSAFSAPYTVTIPQAQLIEAVGNGAWSNPATWSTNAIPTRYDSVLISNGYEVTIDVNNATAFHVVVDSGKLLYETTSQALNLKTFGSVWVNKNGIFTVPTTPTLSNTALGLSVRGNVTNKGVFNLYRLNTGNQKEAAATLTFFGSNNSYFTSDSGVITNLSKIAMDREGITDSVFFRPRSLTIRDFVTDAQSGNGFVDANNWAGTLVIDGNFSLENRFFAGTNSTTSPQAGLWLKNDSLVIPAQNTNITFNGTLRISEGIVNIGNTHTNIVNGSFNLILEGGELNIGGRLYSTNATGFTQKGGILRVAVAGNSTTQPSLGVLGNADIKMLGGQIIIVQPATPTTHIDYSVWGNSESEFTGTLVKFTEKSGQAGSRDFIISGNLPHLLTDSAIGSTEIITVSLDDETHIHGNFNLTDNDALDLKGNYLFLHDSINNDGNVYASFLSGAVVIGGDKQVLMGKGTINTPRLEIVQTQPTSLFTIPAANLIQTVELNLSRGNVANAKYLVVGDEINNISVEVGHSGDIYPGAQLDSFPTVKQGTTEYNLVYQNLNTNYTTGFEIFPGRVVNSLTVYTDSAITLIGGTLEVLNWFDISNGVLNTSSANMLRVTNPADNAVTGGNATAYVNGPLTRKIGQNLNGETYVYPVGAGEYRSIEINNIKTDSTIAELTVEFNSSVLNYTPGNGVTQIDSTFGYWTLKADSNANSLTEFGLEVNYKTGDGFIRLAAGKTNSLTATPVIDSVGGITSVISPILIGQKLSIDSANNVMFVAPGEYLGDTLFNNQVFRVGKGKDFENLTAIARKLSSSYIAGNVTFLITQSYDDATEQLPVIFTQMRYAGNGGKVLIRLDSNTFGVTTGSKTKSLATDYGMITFYGADNIEFDGAGYDIVGNPTNTREWTFKTETNPTAASVFVYRDDACRNTLNNLNIITNATGNNAAVFYTNTHANGTGNDFNTVKNSFITNSDRITAYGILSIGQSAQAANDSIQVINNEISNFATAYIELSSNTGAGCKISGNHFFLTDTRLNTYVTKIVESIDANTSGIEISYNYIGGTQKWAAGSQWVYSSTATYNLFNLTANSKVPSVLKGNVIKNLYQSSTSSFLVRPVNINTGYWVISGNKFGGTSISDRFLINTANIFSMIFVNNNANAKVEITDNEFSYIYHNTQSTGTVRAFKAIDYQSPVDALIARNKIHDIYTLSRKVTSMQDGAFTGIYINNTATQNVIEQNEIYDIYNNYTNLHSYNTGIGINNGGGYIRNNKIYSFNYISTSASLGHIVGIHAQGNYRWDIYNNQIELSNANYPNKVVSLQGIRYYSIHNDFASVANNTIVLSGATINSTSYAFVQGNATSKVELYNNIIVNSNQTNNTSTYRNTSVYGLPASGNLRSDFNFVYSTTPTNTMYNASTNVWTDLATWQANVANDSNSITGWIPNFRNTPTDLLLTLDTINWLLNAAGRAVPVETDYEADVRHTTQPDIGADEFGAPMYNTPVFIGGNDTLCAGSARTLVAQNPNAGGNIFWFSQPYGGDTLHMGDTLVTAVVNSNTAYYIQVSDSLMRSYRIEVPVRVIPVATPMIKNLPVDSICNGTVLDLVADAAPGVMVEWYDSLTAVTPFNTGNTYNTNALTGTVTYYISTIYQGCVSPKEPFTILVSDTTVGKPSIADQTVCAGTPVSWVTNGPDVIRWYTGEFETTPFVTDTTFNTNTLNADTAYWFEAYNGRCANNRRQVSVTVNPIPAAPVIDSLFTICYNTGITLAPVVSGTASWYTDAVATTPFASGTINLNNLLADTTLFVDNTLAGCVGPRVSTTIKVHTPATVNVVSLASPVCYNTNSQIVLGKTGPGTISWYTQPAGGSSIATGDTLATSQLTADKTYYFELNDGLCATPRDSATIFVTPFAVKPVITPINPVCFGESDTLIATASGAVINWYENKTSAPVATSTDFVIPAITGNKKYFAKAVYAGCESDFEEVSLQVRVLPQPPVVDSVPLVCRGSATTLTAHTAATAEWYNNPFATTPVATGNTYTTPNVTVNTTLYVQAFDGVCRSEKRPVAVALRNIPTAPVVKTTDPFCWGDAATIEAGSNSLVRWYKTAADTVHFLADSSVYIGKVYKDTSFYIESYDGFCTSNKVAYNVGVLRYLDNFSFSVPDSVNIATQVTLSATGNVDNLYGWNFGAGSNISSATGTGPHNIEWNSKGFKNVRLTVTKRSGNVTCDTVFTRTVKIYNLSELLGLAGINNTSLLTVYPNPASNVVTIGTQGDNTLAAISLFDINGREVYAETLENVSQKTVDVQALAQGVYLLHITLGNNQIVVQKVIVE